MKRNSLALLLLLAAASAATAADPRAALPQSAPQTFTWEAGGITVTVPADWKKRAEGENGVRWIWSTADDSESIVFSINRVEVKPGPPAPSMIDDRLASDQKRLTDGKLRQAELVEVDGVRGVFAVGEELAGTTYSGTVTWTFYYEQGGQPRMASFFATTRRKSDTDLAGRVRRVVESAKFRR